MRIFACLPAGEPDQNEEADTILPKVTTEMKAEYFLNLLSQLACQSPLCVNDVATLHR